MTQHVNISLRDDIFNEIESIRESEDQKNRSEFIESLIRIGIKHRK